MTETGVTPGKTPARLSVRTNLRAGLYDALQQRLNDLRNEYAYGQQHLAELQRKDTELNQKLLRLSGGIQYLEEELRSYTG